MGTNVGDAVMCLAAEGQIGQSMLHDQHQYVVQERCNKENSNGKVDNIEVKILKKSF